MKKIDSALDIRSLRIFLAISKHQTLSRAAEELAMKQSTLSHALAKLRIIFNDELFVRSGKKFVATSRASELIPQIDAVLTQLHNLSLKPEFDAASADINYTIAANDFQARMLLPALYQRIGKQVHSLKLNIVPSALPDYEMLRSNQVDLVISPRAPQSGDIMQRKLYDFEELCYYDPKMRNAPTSSHDFASANYVLTNFYINCTELIYIDASEPINLRERTQIITNSFAECAQFIKNSTALTLIPASFQHPEFKQLAHCECAFLQKESMYLIWNKRLQQDPQHSWLRQQIAQIAATLNAANQANQFALNYLNAI